MSMSEQLRSGIGSQRSLYEEELVLLERSGTSPIDVGTAMDMLTAAMQKAYPKVDASEIEGLVTHHVGKAMREARAMSGGSK